MSPSAKTSLSIALCLAALLLLASLGAAGLQPAIQQSSDAAQPQAAGDLALPERVVLSGADASGSAVVGIDAGAAVDSSGSQLEGAYERHLLEERIASADTDTERRAAINASVDDLERRAQDLREREGTARRAYRAGEIDAAAYLATLRSVNDRAAQLEQRANLIAPPPGPDSEGLADIHDASTARNRISQLRGEIVALQGPVRDGVSERVQDGAGPARFHVMATQNETVVAYLDDGTYYRQATRWDVLAQGDETGIGINTAWDMVREELYPQYQDHYSFSGVSVVSTNEIYRIQGEQGYDHGSIEFYVDAVSENVFWEAQQMTLSSDLPRAQPITNASGNLSVAVRPTYDTGPASVQVTDDGTPVANETVMVDGEPVAETDENGLAWVVLPDDSPNVRVTAGGQSADVTVNWETVYQ